MKKIFLAVITVLAICLMPEICMAKCSSSSCHCGGSHSHSSCHSHGGGGYRSHGGSDSRPVYLINQTYSKEEHKFPNCTKHYAITEVTTSIYSDGSKRIYSTSSVYNSDGSVLIDGCFYVKHFMNNNAHYFLARTNKGFQIFNSNGEVINNRIYSYMELLTPDRFLVRYNKMYGIIDLKENVIVPIKYQKFNSIGKDLFITKLNGYYGMIDMNNKIYLENDCSSIKPLYDTYVVKSRGKYGLVSQKGEILLPPIYDKVKKLGGYILVKSNKKYGVLDVSGQPLSRIEFTKVKLNKNRLECYTQDKGLKYISD